MSAGYITIMASRNPADIDFFASVLHGHGIQAAIKNEHFASTFTPMAAMLSRGVELQVPEEQVERALAIIDDPQFAQDSETYGTPSGTVERPATTRPIGPEAGATGFEEAAFSDDDFGEDEDAAFADDDYEEEDEAPYCPNCGSENVRALGRPWDWAELLLTLIRLGDRPDGPQQWVCADCQWDWRA